MVHTTSDGAKIGVDAVKSEVVVTFAYKESSGKLSLVKSHAKVLSSGATEMFKKYGAMLNMYPTLKVREPDIKAVIEMLAKAVSSP